MKKRYCQLVIGCLLYMGALSLQVDVSPAMASQEDHVSKPTETSMNLAYETTTQSAVIPAIDADAPAVVETASFGLG